MLNYKKQAFTMLELVMVIVVLGILAALAMPRIERDIRQEAAEDILSAIRYTQHLALMDDVKGENGSTATSDVFKNSWHRSLWSFGFQGCSDDGIFYFVASDTSRQGNIDAGEEAMDPSNGLPMNGLNTSPCESDVQNGVSPNIFITNKYGISDGNIAYSGGCGAVQYIAFDYMGRPHTAIRGSTTPNYATVLQSDCNLTFSFDGGYDPFSIIIERETGHAFIDGQPNS